MSFMPVSAGGPDGPAVSDDDDMDIASNDGQDSEDASSPPPPPSLIIPITSSERARKENLFIEIFPEEMSSTPSATLLQVLRDENAPLKVWADAGLLYMQQPQYRQHSRDASTIFQAACDLPDGTNDEKLRVLASAGIAHLTQTQQSAASAADVPGNDPNADLRRMADLRFNNASKINISFPMVWMGRGMLNLSFGRFEQARFFFETTLKEVKTHQNVVVLPALLGMAATHYGEKKFREAQEMYIQAIRSYPEKSGAAARVGFGLTCYKLGQVDRAKAAFARALTMDPENVDAMVGVAILDMASLDETSKEFNSLMEKAIKMMSMANLLDHSNAMVQNHLANHYFWKWTPVAGTVEMTQGSNLVKGSQPIPLDPGERVRIGTDFETQVADDEPGDDDKYEDGTTIRIQNPWKKSPIKGLKLWKKDFDRVEALAKGAYNSTSVKDIQAESLFFLARVYHVRGNIEMAHKFYEQACKLSPNLSPARFGMAQTLIAQSEYDQAIAHLQLVLGTSSTATDALAALGLLEVKSGNPTKVQEGIHLLRKSIDFDPLNPDLILLEALALQQHETNFPKSLERYKKAVHLMGRQGRAVSYETFTNIGVLCHETKKYDESLQMYQRALDALDEDGVAKEVTLDNVGKEGAYIRHENNDMFAGYVSSELKVEYPSATPAGETLLKIVDSGGKDISSLPLLVGDYIQLDEKFETQISEIVSLDEGVLAIKIKDPFNKVEKTSAQNKDESEKGNEGDDDDEKEKENEGDEAGGSKEVTQSEQEKKEPIVVFVKRENKHLENPSAISIAFNLARLHEVTGRTLAAVELHKAIVKRNPAYVNSYLRLACIAIDCAALKECAGWLKIALETAPGNPEVLALIGNLHLSLCDWAPAQQVFDGLLAKKVPNVEAFSMISLGNIYFANLKTVPKRYAKHLQYSADYYKRILSKDKANAYAANGLGTILAEKGELFKAKEVFNRVREVSGDTIADTHLNLGHIYLAQKKHPEALQMYQSYMKRTEDGTAPISSKSRVDDIVDVLLYISFAYFDWARQTELSNNTKAAPADERYKKAMEYLQEAIEKNTTKRVLLTYNLCMTKLQAANCVLQKTYRNIRRTAQEVEEALEGLEESLTTVEEILRGKTEEKLKVPIATSTLNDFLSHCRSNIDSAKSHLEDERRREAEANEIRQLQFLAAEEKRKQKDLEKQRQKEEETRRQEERDQKARAKMRQVEDLRAGWEQLQEAEKKASEKKSKKNKTGAAPDAEDDGLFPEEPEDAGAVRPSLGLFDSDDSDNEEAANTPADKNDKETDGDMDVSTDKPAEKTTEQDLFGDSEDESDEELLPSSAVANKKREAETSAGDNDDNDEQPAKKQKVVEDDDDDEGEDEASL